jgi:hypothetical protein
MKALCWMDTRKVEVHTVDDPAILNPHDAIACDPISASCKNRKMASARLANPC